MLQETFVAAIQIYKYIYPAEKYLPSKYSGAYPSFQGLLISVNNYQIKPGVDKRVHLRAT